MSGSYDLYDSSLEEFRNDFRLHVESFAAHIKVEEDEQAKQQELYTAIFQKEDKDAGKHAGLLQLTSRIDARLEGLEKREALQKTFVGGVLFALGSIGFFLTDSAHKLFELLRSL